MEKKTKIPTWEELREMQAETDRRFKNSDRLIDRLSEEISRVTQSIESLKEEGIRVTRNIDTLNKEIGGLSQNIGLHAEQYFRDALGKELCFGGI